MSSFEHLDNTEIAKRCIIDPEDLDVFGQLPLSAQQSG